MSEQRTIEQRVSRLKEALRGLLTFRDNKDYWDELDDVTIKDALEKAFKNARDALKDA